MRLPMFSQRAIDRFLHALTYWLRGGIQLDQALHGINLVSQESRDRALNRLSRDMRRASQNGKALSASLSAYLEQDEQSILIVGEHTGSVLSALEMIVENRDFASSRRQQLWRAMAYPSVLASGSFVVLYIVAAHLAPAIQSIYQTEEASAINGGAQWVQNYLVINFILFMIMLVLCAWRVLAKKLEWRETRFARKLTADSLSFCQVLALSFQGTKSLVEIFAVLQTQGSLPIRNAIARVTGKLRHGVSKLEHLLAVGLIPNSILFEVHLLRKEGVNQRDIMLKVCKRVCDYRNTRHRNYIKYAATLCYSLALVNIALVVFTLSDSVSSILQHIV